jgi:4-hydroxybenzoate polyprenyltransferase
VKDVEDIEGDKLLGLKTLPIVLGYKKTKVFLKALLIISIFGLSFYFSNNWIFNVLNCVLMAIYIYLLLEITKAEDKKNYHRISSILKYSMVIGLICAYWLN